MNTKPQSTETPRRRWGARRGISMLELVIAGSMLAVVMTSLSVVMRTARQSWEACDNDVAMLHQAHSVARHFVRAAREANQVASIKAGGTGITLVMNDGTTNSWIWNAVGAGGIKDVVFVRPSSATADTLLAYDIDKLTFRGFAADAVTPVTDPDEMRLIEVTVEVVLPRGYNARQSVQSKVWLRSW